MADVIRKSKYPRDKIYAEMTREERDRWIRLGISPKVSTKDKKTIRPKDTLKGTTGTKVKRKEGTEKRAYFGPQGGSNLAKNLRPAPPPRFSRIQYPGGGQQKAPSAKDLHKKVEVDKKRVDKKRVDSDKIIPPAIARVISKITPQKPINIKIAESKTVPKLERVIRAEAPPKPKAPKPKPKAPKPPVVKTKTPKVPKTITVKTGLGKTTTKVIKPEQKTKIQKWTDKNKKLPHENSKRYLTRALQALGIIKTGATLASGLGAFLYLMKPKSISAADDPEAAIKRGEAAARKRVGSSLDYKHGGKIARYSTGRSIKRGLIKDVPDGNDFVKNIYDN